MERPDFFTLKNGEKVKLPFSNSEYNQRVDKLRTVMNKNNIDVEVTDGLQIGDILVLEGANIVEDSQRVKLIN